jgi:ribosomal protein S18 acetylase RimI-like enzyme
MREVQVRALGAEDANACGRIVAPASPTTSHTIRAGSTARWRSTRPGLADEDGEVLGFLTYVYRFDEAAEITWMAVRADRRRGGIGHALIDRLAEKLVAEGRRVMMVLTVSPSDPGPEPDDGYGSTRAFYRSTGFVLGRDLRGEWDADTAVLMVRSLAT